MLTSSDPGSPDVGSADADVQATAPRTRARSGTPILSHDDHLRLRAGLDGLPSFDPMLVPLHAKLRDARLVAAGELGDDVARSGSRVVYCLPGRRQAHRRTLVLSRPPRGAGCWLSVLTPVGLALLGARAGWEVTCPSAWGRPLAILLKRVEANPGARADRPDPEDPRRQRRKQT